MCKRKRTRRNSSDSLQAIGLSETTAEMVVDRTGTAQAENAVKWVKEVVAFGDEERGVTPEQLDELLAIMLKPNANLSDKEVQVLFIQEGIPDPDVPFRSLRSFLSGAQLALRELKS